MCDSLGEFNAHPEVFALALLAIQLPLRPLPARAVWPSIHRRKFVPLLVAISEELFAIEFDGEYVRSETVDIVAVFIVEDGFLEVVDVEFVVDVIEQRVDGG